MPAVPNTTPTTSTKTTKTKKKTRRKKAPAGGNSSTSPAGGSTTNKPLSSAVANATLLAAAKATKELADLKAEAEARKSDAAWLSPEMLAVALKYMEKGGGYLEKESEILERALRKNGFRKERHLTPRAYGALLEHGRRYACELIADAQDYAWHCSRRDITSSDLKLAAEMRDDFTVQSTLPPREAMMELADDVNKIPLPHIPSNCYHGVVLPSNECMITARTFDVLSTDQVKEDQEINDLSKEDDDETKKKKKAGASYGANKGRQITVNINTKEIAKKVDVPPTSAGPGSNAAGSGAVDSSATPSSASGPVGEGGTKRKADEFSFEF